MAQAGDEVLQQSFAMGPRPLGLQGWDRPPGARAGGGGGSPAHSRQWPALGRPMATAWQLLLLQCCSAALNTSTNPSDHPWTPFATTTPSWALCRPPVSLPLPCPCAALHRRLPARPPARDPPRPPPRCPLTSPQPLPDRLHTVLDPQSSTPTATVYGCCSCRPTPTMNGVSRFLSRRDKHHHEKRSLKNPLGKVRATPHLPTSTRPSDDLISQSRNSQPSVSPELYRVFTNHELKPADKDAEKKKVRARAPCTLPQPFGPLLTHPDAPSTSPGCRHYHPRRRTNPICPRMVSG